jgi:hypothetical protein
VQVNLPVGGAQLTLLDATGRRVRELRTASPVATLELAGLPSGLYVVRAVTAGGVNMQRLVVEAD